MRVAVYYRVSSTRQTFDSQKIEVEKWLALHKEKITKVKIFSDYAMSGVSDKRPGYTMLVKECQRGRFDTLVVYNIDRLYKKGLKLINLLLNFSTWGVEFVSVSQPVLSFSKDDPVKVTLLAAFSELVDIERENLSQSIKSGLLAAKRRGVTLGRPNRISCECKNAVIAMRAKNMTVVKIAARLGISRTSAHKIIKDNEKEDE